MSMPDSPRPSLRRSLSEIDSLFQPEIDPYEPDEVHEDELTEAELREIYDREEIDRFLTLFSTFVTEVQAPITPSSLEKDAEFGFKVTASPPVQRKEEVRSSVDSELAPSSSTSTSGENVPVTQPAKNSSLSEEIACNYLLPMLPYPRARVPPFTIGRLRVTLQRLYLAALHVHKPFFEGMLKLATWQNHETSLFYCVIFWILWWNNLLVSAVIVRIMISLLKRKVFPYPTLDDLRRHREDVNLASDFGQQVSDRLSASSFGITETWRLLRLVGQTQKSILKGKAKGKLRRTDTSSTDIQPEVSDQQDTTILDDPDDSEETKDLKRVGLQLLNDIADLHERVRNIFIWRRPKVSWRYAFILALLFLVTLLPAQYGIKLVFFTLGFAFWHVTPVLAALPSSAWDRLPPPFCDAPTDAEYAMELISRRVAAGLEVEPSRLRKKSKKQKRPSDSVDTLASTASDESQSSSSSSVDWRKWGDRLAFGKSVVNDIKRLKPGNPWPVHEVWPPRHPIIPGAIGIAQPQSNIETRTYPCQHSSAPGLITLTQKTLFFTPLMSHDAKLVIQLTAVKGVKKSGLLKGILIKWNDFSEGKNEQKEEKFLWVGGRDELFARLVGSNATRWMRM